MHLCVLCAFLLVTGIVHAQAQKLPKLTLAGPSAAVSNALIHMVDSGALNDIADVVEFVPWRDPDQLRVMALDGRADVLAMPTNVAANLYNRGAKLQLINVSTWGVLWLVSRDPALKSLADLRGKELAMPFRGDMPDIVLQLLAEQQGLDVKKDLQLRYVASPVDAMQLLVMRRVDHALLAEPAASMALRKTGSFPLSMIAPELHRSVDLQQEWGRVFARAARIPQAGIAVMGALRERPELVARI
ncbi:MAG: PhnD/SsuA/transferrin family substrate-binding protein, partial [Thauera sp.]|nr:PhnD/SsuA/transferrin family substrate-binding protein [Thauera sp.]